ncbi:ParA family protein [Tepidimonas taiwanensis]|uniref:Cellulose synthase operon protein YhjQ n=1 Tax=Tepidimonas taiwanensis TaxID=307486 RepID=A0A554X4D3_9BURK|nr:ParA family protein [Tepidimonas taiwanensis]MCX7693617.1 ParA family protein [Tepidimonas taiwanensis]TSE30704.1 cellulose synthase operon protein YhjQ [Tepidimonas taiwanensis]UBQ05999.1 ParA family protein [Tepidimonas taiwanensis]
MMGDAPRCVVVLNSKGGTGKTTLAVHLAAGWSRRVPTAIGDLDPQGSATQWATRAGLTVLSDGDAWAAPAGVQRLVWDCPPSVEHPAARRALARADIVVVPVLPSPLDLWASWRLVEAIAAEQARRPGLRAWLVVNQVEPGSVLSGAMHEALREFGLPALRAVVRRRAIYRSAALQGKTAYQMGARAAPAVADIEALIEEMQT